MRRARDRWAPLAIVVTSLVTGLVVRLSPSGDHAQLAFGFCVGGVLTAPLALIGRSAYRDPEMRDWVDHDKVLLVDLPRRLVDEFREAERGPERRRREARTRAWLGVMAWGRTEHYARFRRVYAAVSGSLLAVAAMFVIDSDSFDPSIFLLMAVVIAVVVVTGLVWRKASARD